MINFQFFPRSQGMTTNLLSVVDCFEKIEDKLHDNNKLLTSNEVLERIRPLLESIGYRVEVGKSKDDMIIVPVLFGENNKIDKAFFADALSADGKIVIEVEAGRAVKNNQFLKDIFQACMMLDVDYLVIAVLNEYKYNSSGKVSVGHDYHEIKTFLETLYSSERLKLPLKGILLLGY